MLTTPEENAGIDIPGLLWRWKWLLVCGVSIGLIVGWLRFSGEEPTYRSQALVQVVYPSAEAAGISTLNGQESIRGQTRLDETMIIKSTRVIDLAIEDFALASLPRFRGMTPTAIRGWILGGNRLSVQPAGRDSSTALIEIAFICEDPKLSQSIVDAIIGGYDSYLELAYRNLGNEVVNVATEARDTLQTSYKELSEKHATFRKEAPMIWLGDEARNQFAENSIEVNSSINQIEIEKGRLEATLEHVSEVESQGRDPEAILIMLASEQGFSSSVLGEGLEPLLANFDSQSESLPFTPTERRRMLLDLQMREQELLDTVGEEHPAVASIRRRIGLISEQLDSLVETKKEMAEQRELTGERSTLESMSPKEKLGLWRSSMIERLASLEKQLAALQNLADENQRKSKDLQTYLTQNRLLNSELASVESLMKGFTDTLNRLDILPEDNRRTLETLTPASIGGFFGPSLPPYLLGGAAVGFLCIAGIGVLLEWLDKGFRSPEDVASSLNLSVLGHVPEMPLKTMNGFQSCSPSLCTLTNDCEPANEAFKTLRTGLYFNASKFGEESDTCRVIQVTSPTPGDGKSTVSTNLAISIAQSGRRVLLIDADLRRPQVSKLFGSDSRLGLGDYIQGSASFGDVIQQTATANLQIIASSRPVGNPSELLSHQRFADILEITRDEFDYIIVDSPPILAVSDAAAIAARVDGVVLTLRLKNDAKPIATHATRILRSVNANLLGIVVNGVGNRSYKYEYSQYSKYSYGGKYGYGNVEKDYTPSELPKSMQEESTSV